MNKDLFAGNWKILKGKIKENWGKLTDDELATVNGKRDQLVGLIQKKYGYAKDRVEKELTSFEKNFDSSHEYSTQNAGSRGFEQSHGSSQTRGGTSSTSQGFNTPTQGHGNFGKPSQNPTQGRTPNTSRDFEKGSKGKR